MFAETKLIGEVISSPHRSVTATGIEATAFKLITHERSVNTDTSTKPITNTHHIEYYGDTAAYINNAVVIGCLVCVVGHAETQPLLEPTGDVRFVTTVIGDHFSLFNAPQPHPIEDKDIQLSLDPNSAPMRYPQFKDNVIPQDTFDSDIHCVLAEKFIPPKERKKKC